MPRYADSDKEKVREAVDLVDLVSTRTELRRAGPGRYMGRCPFHEERSPSFSVDTGKGLYHCFGCGVGGDAFRFVMETEGLDFVGAMESLAQRYGIELTVEDEDPAAAERRKARERLLELLERAAGFYERWLWESAEAAPARAYLAERGLSEETLKTFRVGYAPSAWDKLLMVARAGRLRQQGDLRRRARARGGKGEGRHLRPLPPPHHVPAAATRAGACSASARARWAPTSNPSTSTRPTARSSTRATSSTAPTTPGCAAARADEVIAAEGYTDVLALHQAGMKNVVGIMGTALTEKQVGELAKLGQDRAAGARRRQRRAGGDAARGQGGGQQQAVAARRAAAQGAGPGRPRRSSRGPMRRASWSSARCRSCASRSSASWSAPT